MNVVRTAIPDVIILEPGIFVDDRGTFFESFNQRAFSDTVGAEITFVQDNHSRSVRNVLRGLHYQIGHAQGKLVRVVSGEVFDVAVDLRRASPTFGQYSAVQLSAQNRRMVWIPEGFAHGFLVISEFADFLYKTTDYWHPDCERTLIWNDPDVAISWPLHTDPLLSAKDRAGAALQRAEVYR